MISRQWRQTFRRVVPPPMAAKFGGLAMSTAIRTWMDTLEYKMAYYDPAVDLANVTCGDQRYLYLIWHEYILYYMYLRQHCDISVMMSMSRDADVLDRTASHLGFTVVRGSTNKAPVRAVRRLMEAGVARHLALAPDGPRGPRRRLAPGPIYLSSKLQMPIVCVGVGYDRPWRLNSWDRFAIPRPGTRARCVPSPAIQIPSQLAEDALEHYRAGIERLLNRLCAEAEAWAAAGTPKVGEVSRHPRHAAQHGLHNRSRRGAGGRTARGVSRQGRLIGERLSSKPNSFTIVPRNGGLLNR